MKPIKESSPKTRRKFDPTFKREAVGNWLSSGRSAAVLRLAAGVDEITVPGGRVVKIFHEGEQRGLVPRGEMFAGGAPAAGLLGGLVDFLWHGFGCG